LIVPKGYVCLDGVSLTVIDVDWESRTFTIMMIAYTQEKGILLAWIIF
jgi:riboflavin synthase